MKKQTATIFTLSFALFAMFFGAGNLVLPPFIGKEVGSFWGVAILGFFLTAIVAPFLGILTIIVAGKSFNDLEQRIPKSLVQVLGFLIILCIGPIVGIPRTGATTFEVGIQPLLPSLSSPIFAIFFFTVVYFLSVSQGKIVDIIGKYLTPILIITLVVLITWGIFQPTAPIEIPQLSAKEVFSFSFLEGYQTLDVLASVVFAGIIVTASIEKGFTTVKERIRANVLAGAFAMLALLFIYGGLIYLGATSGYAPQEEVSRTELLIQISKSIFGPQGTLLVSIAMSLACLTTAIALTSATATFFNELTKGKLKYPIGVLICCIISAVLSVFSVDEIIGYAIYILLFVYPIVFSLIIHVLLFGKLVKTKPPYVVALAVAAVISAFTIAKSFFTETTWLTNTINHLPLSNYSLEWLLPSMLAFLMTVVLTNKK